MTTTQQADSAVAVDEAIAQVEQQLGVLFGRVRLNWKEAAAQVHPDLQPVGYKILSMIVRLEETNASAIAEALETDKAVISRQVRMLEESGLVASRVDERDARARLLSPTPTAVTRVGAVREQQQARLRELLRSRPEHEVRIFAGMLQLISGG